MKRIDIVYGGEHYSVAGRALDEVTRQIDETVANGGGWIEVNYGEGTVSPAVILVAAGVPIALLPVTGDEPEA